MRSKKLCIIIACLILSVCYLYIPFTDVSYADDETTYTIFIYSGKEGYFGDKAKRTVRIDGQKYGEKVTVDLSSYGLVLEDPEKYYVRGMKISGHDNDELSSRLYRSYTFTVTEDTSFSVAYGIRGGMVKYTVRYVDEDGKSLSGSDEFYGMAGDQPVVACKYIEGYVPETENVTGTLTDKESENVFTFVYKKEGTPSEGGENEGGENEGGENDNPGTPGENGGDNGYSVPDNPGGEDGTENGQDGDGSGNETVDPNGGADNNGDVTDIDENEAPLTDADSMAGRAAFIAKVAGGGALILVLIFLLLFLLKRRRNEE